MQNSRIEWTDHTFNPWIGCTKVSPGCKNCYAETYGNRFGVQWGPQGERRRTSPANWRKPITWNHQNWMQCLDCGWRGQATTRNARFACDACRSENVEPTRQRVFCASLADVFEDRPELNEWRQDLFGLIRATPNLDWLLLTKRPENIMPMFTFQIRYGGWITLRTGEVLQNLWLGVSVENQEQANRRIPALLTAWDATVKFLSCEPLLGNVDLTTIPISRRDRLSIYNALTGEEPIDPSIGLPRGAGPAIRWVIAGGESGPHARPMHPDWARSLRDQCAAANVPFLFKQWGEYLPDGQIAEEDKAGKDMRFHMDGLPTYRIGKHDAGRFLDGCIHNSHPHSPRG